MFKVFRPFYSPSSDGDYITIFFTAILFLILIFAVFKFLKSINGLRRELRKYSADEKSKLAESIYLSTSWKAYESTFGYGEIKKTKEDSSDFFNENTLIFNNSNFRLYLSLPNIFVGFGILGTFVGLVYGISSFDDLSDSKAIKDSIQVLLSGMGTAFYTSIVGMLFSIGFNIFEKFEFNKTLKLIREFNLRLNSQFKISQSEEDEFQKNELIKVIEASFGFSTEEGHIIPPKMVFLTMHRELQEQSRALKSFSTDLANSLQVMSDIIMEEFDQSFQKAFKETLLPIIEKLESAVEALKNEKTSTNENLINSTIEALKQSLEDMVKEFKDTLSGSAKQELEDLLTILSSSSNALLTLPDVFSGVEASLKETLSQFNAESENQRRNLQLQEEKSRNKQDELNSITNETISQAKLLVNSSNELIEKFATQASVLNESIASYTHLISTLNDTASNINLASSKLNQSVDSIERYSQKTIETNKLLTENFEKRLEDITKLNRHHVESYERIKESLDSVFEGIDEGLTAYRDHTIQSLNTYLGEFSEKLAKASGALSGSIEDLNDGLDDLNDFLGKIKR